MHFTGLKNSQGGLSDAEMNQVRNECQKTRYGRAYQAMLNEVASRGLVGQPTEILKYAANCFDAGTLDDVLKGIHATYIALIEIRDENTVNFVCNMLVAGMFKAPECVGYIEKPGWFDFFQRIGRGSEINGLVSKLIQKVSRRMRGK